MINRRILYRLSIEAGKEQSFSGCADRILNLFLPRDNQVWAAIQPLHLGWEIYEEIYAAFFSGYEFVQACIDLIDEWFVLDEDLEPMEYKWHDLYFYPDENTDRNKYPPMVLKDVTEQVPKYERFLERNRARGKFHEMMDSES